MRQHPQAPLWNWPNGEQLNAAGLAQVSNFAADLESKPVCGPRIAARLAGRLRRLLPGGRAVLSAARSPPARPIRCRFHTCSRADLAPKVWDFVPDSQPLDELIVFSSSGTTGLPTQTPAHPASAACGIPLIERAIAATGITFPRGPEQMALTNIAAYRGAYTTAIVIAWLQEAGLHPREPQSRSLAAARGLRRRISTASGRR